jgi:hypothetical protein
MTPALRQALLGPPGWVRALSPGSTPSLALDFANARYWGPQTFGAPEATPGWSFSRTGVETDLATGATQFATGVPVILAGLGLQVYEARTNSFLNSAAPVTQSITLGTGTYVVGVWGSGSATSSAGTATGSGFGAAAAGSPNVFTLTGAGSVTITIGGSPTFVDVQLGAFLTPHIPTAGASATRGAASASVGGLSLPVACTIFAETGPYVGTGNAGILRAAPLSAGTYVGIASAGGNVTGWAASGLAGFAGASTSTNNKTALVLNTGGVFRACRNGGAVSGSTSSDYTGGSTSIDLGQVTGGSTPLNGYLRRVVIYPQALTDAQIQAMTT